VENETGKEVRCEKCGCAFEPEVLTERDGDIEYTFFRCAYCGKAYMVSVTNGSLRDSIRKYIEMAERNREKRLSEPEQFEMQALKAANVQKAAELRKAYLKEDADGGE
jgi:uncharacterized Zn finger protein